MEISRLFNRASNPEGLQGPWLQTAELQAVDEEVKSPCSLLGEGKAR